MKNLWLTLSPIDWCIKLYARENAPATWRPMQSLVMRKTCNAPTPMRFTILRCTPLLLSTVNRSVSSLFWHYWGQQWFASVRYLHFARVRHFFPPYNVSRTHPFISLFFPVLSAKTSYIQAINMTADKSTRDWRHFCCCFVLKNRWLSECDKKDAQTRELPQRAAPESLWAQFWVQFWARDLRDWGHEGSGFA